MGNLAHTVDAPDGMPLAREDRKIHGTLTGIANAAGAAGATVSTVVTLPESANLPAGYYVGVSPSQGCLWYVSNKTSNSFTVNLIPLSGTAAIAAGTFDVEVSA